MSKNGYFRKKKKNGSFWVFDKSLFREAVEAGTIPEKEINEKGEKRKTMGFPRCMLVGSLFCWTW